ncbi:MAG: DUF975 family protein [Treponema sp.]|nr:DUF975 family protein [Treponema sp.]
MFNRVEYKKAALAQLKNRWTIPCLITLISLFLVSLSAVTGTILSTIVSGILEVAAIFVLMAMYTSSEKVTFDTFLKGLEKTWLHALLASLWYFLWVFLWSLLFIIPGIVKSYSYSMMFFVIAENPEIGATQSMNISKVMTNGHKADLFILDLSFLGWMILSVISCGIGLIWLLPYMTAAKTNAYYELKKMAFQSGNLSPSDFEVKNN